MCNRGKSLIINNLFAYNRRFTCTEAEMPMSIPNDEIYIDTDIHIFIHSYIHIYIRTYRDIFVGMAIHR